MFTCFFALPANPLGKGMVECNGTRFRAHGNTAPSVPALLWIEDNRGFPFLWIGNEDIHLAYLYTDIASVTNIWVKYYRIGGGAPVGKGIYLFLRHPLAP
jgi:hypothetical protein